MLRVSLRCNMTNLFIPLCRPKTTIAEIFAIMRQWVPQVQQNIEMLIKEVRRSFYFSYVNCYMCTVWCISLSMVPANTKVFFHSLWLWVPGQSRWWARALWIQKENWCLPCIFGIILVKLSLKDVWLPPSFFLDFNSPC